MREPAVQRYEWRRRFRTPPRGMGASRRARPARPLWWHCDPDRRDSWPCYQDRLAAWPRQASALMLPRLITGDHTATWTCQTEKRVLSRWGNSIQGNFEQISSFEA